MTLEQIVNSHPCPIIRGKIMENVKTQLNGAEFEKSNLFSLMCIFSWSASAEGLDFWNEAIRTTFPAYSGLKHLDNSYVSEPAKPLPVWRKIDKDNLPKERVAAIAVANPDKVHTGNLYNEDLDFSISGAYLGNTGYGIVLGMTHYIPLSDLINLPIED